MQGYIKMNNNIFETYIDNDGKEKLKLTSAQMRILAMLYSLNRSVKYRAKVRQSTLAKKCGVSISSVKRNIDELWKKGHILGKIRELRNDGTLGTYTYILPGIPKRGYFYVSRQALLMLKKTQTRMYLFLCKCARSKTYDCWNSFNDIANALKISRNSTVKSIRELVELKLVEKMHNFNRNGAFNDNTYIITSNLENCLETEYGSFIDDNIIDVYFEEEYVPVRKPQIPHPVKIAINYIYQPSEYMIAHRCNIDLKAAIISRTRLSRAGP